MYFDPPLFALTESTAKYLHIYADSLSGLDLSSPLAIICTLDKTKSGKMVKIMEEENSRKTETFRINKPDRMNYFARGLGPLSFPAGVT
jgi:hypothetical protein